MSIKVRLSVEQVTPAFDYATMCFKVVDVNDHNEVIYRTADKTYAARLVDAINGYDEAVERLKAVEAENAKLKAKVTSQRERLAWGVSALKELAGNCFESRDCATCKKVNSCSYCRSVARARAWLNEAKVTWHLNTGRGK